MKKIALLTSLLLAGMSTAYAVESPKWDKLTLSYQSMDIDGMDIDDNEIDSFKGFAVSASKLLNEHIFINGQYSITSTDISFLRKMDNKSINIDMDYHMLDVGLGYRYGLNSSTDIFSVLSYKRAEMKVTPDPGSNDANDIWGLEVGVSSVVLDNIELTAAMEYLKYEGDNDISYDLGASYYFSEQFALGVNYTGYDDSNLDIFSVSASYIF